jgi:methyl-accepting chemotaxis protein
MPRDREVFLGKRYTSVAKKYSDGQCGPGRVRHADGDTRKLFAGFGAVLLLFGIVGGFAVVKLGELAENLHHITDVETPGLAAVYEAQEAMRTMQRDVRQGLLVSGDEANRKWQASFEAASKKVDASIATLDTLLYTPAGKENLAALKAAYGAWRQQLRQGRRPGEEGPERRGQRLLQADTTPKALGERTRRLTRSSPEEGARERQGQRGGSGATQARQLVLGLLGAALVLGFGMAFFLARGITSAVATVAGALGRSPSRTCRRSFGSPRRSPPAT